MCVKYAKHGSAMDVLKLSPLEALPKMGAHDITVKMLAAPINPADINSVRAHFTSSVLV